jgi:hypothetical protein
MALKDRYGEISVTLLLRAYNESAMVTVHIPIMMVVHIPMITVHIPMMVAMVDHIPMMTVDIPMIITVHIPTLHTFQLAPLFLQTRCHLVSCDSFQITTAGHITVGVEIITLLRIHLLGNLHLTQTVKGISQ